MIPDQANTVQRLLPRHFKVIELAMAGHDSKTIAETLNIKPTTVALILKSPLVQHEISKRTKASTEETILGLDRDAFRGKVMGILEKATLKAAQVQEELLNNPNPTIALRASDSILDRVFGSRQDGGGAATVINITAENVALLHTALKESEYAGRKSSANSPVAPDPEASEHVDVQETTAA